MGAHASGSVPLFIGRDRWARILRMWMALAVPPIYSTARATGRINQGSGLGVSDTVNFLRPEMALKGTNHCLHRCIKRAGDRDIIAIGRQCFKRNALTAGLSSPRRNAPTFSIGTFSGHRPIPAAAKARQSNASAGVNFASRRDIAVTQHIGR